MEVGFGPGITGISLLALIHRHILLLLALKPLEPKLKVGDAIITAKPSKIFAADKERNNLLNH